MNPSAKPEALNYVLNKLYIFLCNTSSLPGSKSRCAWFSMKQNRTTCSTVCSLQYLDVIENHVHKIPGRYHAVSPSHDEIPSAIPGDLVVKFSTLDTFGTLHQLLVFHGTFRNLFTRDLYVVTKYELASNNLFLSSVIGCSALRCEDGTSPFFCSVIEYPFPHYTNYGGERKILYRHSYARNVIENNFQYSMNTLWLSES